MQRTLVSHLVPGQVVRLEGWVARVRALGGITFVLLRERSGTVQVVLEKGEWPALTAEAVIAVEGRVVANPRAPGGHEVLAGRLEVLNPTQGQLPVDVAVPELACGPEVMLEQRVLTMRHPKQAAVFKLKAAIAQAFASFLRREGFLEIFTPKLIASGTEGGSELFAVPYFGREAFLAQSPQLFKQMLVASGAERVFEVGHVYRAEPHETARHLNEYVSLDVEVGFIRSMSELMELETRLLQHVVAQLHEHHAAELALWGQHPTVPEAIPVVTVAEAQALLAERGFAPSERGDLSPEGERLLCELTGSEWVFVTGFAAERRPFYAMPSAGNPAMTEGNGRGQIAESFDLLYRGLEITTGGQRIHRLAELEARMRERGMEPKAFGAYREAFKHGMPPHGGFAIGLERLTARLLGLSNVREATLFPRTRQRLSP
jgi:nondiscriminating aspartyl-tRNA synthetase